MLDKYSKISIIYGIRGRSCACAMADLISKYHSDYTYPVKAELLAEQYLNCGNIITAIKDIIGSSDICIILLTFDDINNSRVRQNILIELGMAMVLLEPSQYYFFSEKIPLPGDFPSDFKHSINPNYFNPELPEQSAKKIVEYIIEKLKVNSYRNILTDNDYIYDYEKTIRLLPSSIYDLEAETQMQQILREWSKVLESFDFAAERIIYMLERCIFLPLFRYNDALSNFLSQAHELIRPSADAYGGFDTEQVNAMYEFADNILEYIGLVFDQVADMRQNQGQFARERWAREFSSIATDLEQAAYNINSGQLNVNWYLHMMVCDYAGLARMRAVRFSRLKQAEYDSGLKTALLMFNRASTLAQNHCSHSRHLWEGYIQYNISRIYELLYERDRKELYMEGMRDASTAAIDARKRTINKSRHLKGIFTTALTYEYFQALYREYDLEYKWPEFFEGDLADIARKINNALTELNIYCDASGLKQLYDVRDSLRSLLEKTEKPQV